MPVVSDDLLRSILLQGLLPAVSVWGASFYPPTQTTTCKALRINGWDGLQLLIGASEHLRTVTHHEGMDLGEDGFEPAFDESRDYYFLRQEEISSRKIEHAAHHVTGIATYESIDVLVGSYDIPQLPGVKHLEVLAGLRFNQRQGYTEASFGFLQANTAGSLELGPASIIFRDLPRHVRVDRRVAID